MTNGPVKKKSLAQHLLPFSMSNSILSQFSKSERVTETFVSVCGTERVCVHVSVR
jgi:hypothetical protein